ncbi:cysteine-rich receptor-like protein kinase 10 [Eucalyptus grandis]|uniref:cysteine-rich receptor-like protein kinase 10 n=1 Tax=Eucalyptus grandis TaxID=71139 RepID=UPI00192EE018|nr:cysteine-rich receptor-like protein kinase 10 [Eucalyptus grandis]
MVLLSLTCCILRRKRKKTDEVVKGKGGANELTTVESLQFDLATVHAATNYFSHENKLGEGGFGEVFQGKLPDGEQIAVKRLSKSSRQGDGEFKNEILLVAKLQHINLVRLLGFCLEGDEKLLAYEFVPNKSLDYFLFDPQKRRQLNWPLRYKIISGIARGMLYLHEDSRLRIIHRDLKCSNILLDNEMNPKISDFGMARIFGVNQTQASTNKIVGTFGYMSPEYAMHGEFSMKSDVYSFGILLLEIICGKKNNFYHQLDGGDYLASYVWKQWRDGQPTEVLDPAIVDSYSRDEVLRCLHICLLCIQEDPAIRPTMATVVLMLSSNNFNPPSPQHPAFFIQSRLRGLSIPMKELDSDHPTRRTMASSSNGMSLTELYPR